MLFGMFIAGIIGVYIGGVGFKKPVEQNLEACWFYTVGFFICWVYFAFIA